MVDFNFFLPISKVERADNGASRVVSGYASTPTLDLDDEIVSLAAIKAALPEYMEWGAIRQMHQLIAVGTAKEANVDDVGLWLKSKIVDENCIKLLDEEVLKGYSIGGKKVKKEGKTITELELIEISLVDRPANGDCRISVAKSATRDAIFASSASKLIMAPGVELMRASGDDAPPFTPEQQSWLRKVLGFAFGKGGDAPGEGNLPYGHVEYADPGYQEDKQKRYPIDTEAHIRNAWSRIRTPKNRKPYTAGQLKKIEAKIIAAWKAKIDKDGPPAAGDKAALAAGLEKYLVDVCQQPCVATSMAAKENNDTAQAIDALRSLQWLLESELMEDEENEDAQIAFLETAIQNMKEFIASEIMEDAKKAAAMAAALKTANIETAGLTAVTGVIVAKALGDESMLAQLREIYNMSTDTPTLESILAGFAKRGPTGPHKEAMAKGIFHHGEEEKCRKAAHGCLKEVAASMLAHQEAVKAAEPHAAMDHLTRVYHHTIEAHGHLEKGAKHHEAAAMHFGKAAGAEGGPGANVGGGAEDMMQSRLTEGPVPGYDAEGPYPGKAAGYSKEIVDRMIDLAAKAAAAEAKAEVYGNMPMPVPTRRLFGVAKEAFPVGGSGAGQGDALSVLFKGVDLNAQGPDRANEATLQFISNMHDNPQLFAKSTTDPNFRGGAVRRSA